MRVKGLREFTRSHIQKLSDLSEKITACLLRTITLRTEHDDTDLWRYTGTFSAISRTTPSWKACIQRRSSYCTTCARTCVDSSSCRIQRQRGREKDTPRRLKREIPRGRDGGIEQFAKYGAPCRMEPSRFCQIRNYECVRMNARVAGRCNISQYNTRRWRSCGQGTPISRIARLELHLTTTTTTKSLFNSCANGRARGA